MPTEKDTPVHSNALAESAPILTLSREEAFAELLRSERERAIRVAYHLVGGDRAAAEDVAQEAFAKAFKSLASFRGHAKLSTWFLSIVIHEAQSQRRRQGVRERWARWVAGGVASSRVEASSAGIEPGDPALRRRLAAALATLSEGQRQVFSLVHLEGLTVEEASAVLGRSPGTLKSHLHRALVRLRAELCDVREVLP